MEASPAARVDILRALREALLAGLIALGLFLPLIGLNTVQNIHNELVLETRWPLLAVLVAIIAGGRFLQALLIAPWLARRALRPRHEHAELAAWRARLGAVLSRFGDGIENGQAFMRGAAFAWSDTAHDVGSVGLAL